jgi:MOSC domain-containing protein YiiM
VTAGCVHSIHVAPQRGAPTTSVPQVRAVPGKGLVGDRHFGRSESDPDAPQPDRQITLIELETIEALALDCGVHLEPGDARRNIVTRGVALNHLVGRRFTVGAVTLLGLRLCEPCSHLAELTHESVLRGLVHRGGLRAQILTEGVIRVGDEVRAGRSAGRVNAEGRGER